jgi:hypothetical protein
MTFAIGFLLGSMFGACVGFLTVGALRAGRSSKDDGKAASADGTAFVAPQRPAPFRF